MTNLDRGAKPVGWVEDRPTFSEHLDRLFKPPRAQDVLVPGEVVHYAEGRHWMSLAEPLVETVAVLIVVTVILAQPDFGSLDLGLLVLVLSAIVVWRWLKSRTWGYSALFTTVIVGYVMITESIDPLVLVPTVGLWFIARFGVRFLRWYRYEVRYLTNRRIIEATGLLGLRVASMPVTKVTDLVLRYSTPGEIFGYGDLWIESAGQDQSLANVRFLVRPRHFHGYAVLLATNEAKIAKPGKNVIDADVSERIGKK